MSSFLDRYVVPTIGLPHQIIMRLIRAGMDPDIDVFSRKGLLDPHLLPVAGMLASPENNAFAEDLGIKNPWAQFAVDVALDPTTYMGNIPTKAASAARIFGKMQSTDAFLGARGLFKENAKVGEYLEYAQEAAKAQHTSAKDATSFLRAQDELAEFKDLTATELLRKTPEHHLAIGIPGLMRHGAALQVPTSQTSWFRLMGSAYRGFYTYAALTPALRRLPMVGGAIERAAEAEKALRAGLGTPIRPTVRFGGESAQMSTHSVRSVGDEHVLVGPDGGDIGLFTSRQKAEAEAARLNKEAPTKARWALDYISRGEAAADDVLEEHHGLAGELAEALADRDVAARWDLYINKQKGGYDKGLAMLSALGISYRGARGDAGLDRYVRAVSSVLGIKELPGGAGDMAVAASKFLNRHQEAAKIIKSMEILPEVAAGKWDDSNLYALGQNIRKFWNKAFRTDVGIEDLMDLEKSQRSLEAGADEQIQAVARHYFLRASEIAHEMFPELAKRRGGPEAAIAKLLRGGLEMKILPEEILWRRESILTGESVHALQANIGNFLTRSIAAMRELKRARHAGQGLSDADFGVGRLFDEDGGALARTDLFLGMDEVLDPAQRELMDEATLKAIDSAGESNYNMFRLVRRVERVGKDDVTKIEERAGDYLAFVSDTTLQREERRLAALASPSDNERATLGAIRGLIAERTTGAARQVARPPSSGKGAEFRRITGVDPKDLNMTERAMVRLAAVRAEMTRWLEANAGKPPSEVVVPASLYDEFENAAFEWNSIADEAMDAVLGEAGRPLMNALEKMRSAVYRQHRDAGLLGVRDMPLGYLPRVASHAVKDVIRKLNAEMPDEVAQKLGVSRAHLNERSLDALTIDQVNALARSAEDAGLGDVAKKIDAIMASEGVKREALTSDPGEALLTALASANSERNIASWGNRVLASGADSQLMEGKIVGVYESGREGKRTTLRTLTGRPEDFGASIEVSGGSREFEVPYAGIVLEDSKGKARLIPMSSLRQGAFRMAALGHIGNTAGDALAMALGRNEVLDINGKVPLDYLRSMIGQRAIFGTEAHVGAMLAGSRMTLTRGADMLRAMDAFNYGIKKWQTLYRPAFHVSNYISGFHQSLMLGTSLKSTIMGNFAAARWLMGGSADEIRKFDELGAILGEARIYGGGATNIPGTKQLLRVSRLVDAVRRVGGTGKRLTHEDYIELGLEDFAQRTLAFGKTRITGEDLLQAVAEGEFLGTYAARGFSGGAAVTTDIAELKRFAEEIAAGTKKSKALGYAPREHLRGIAEASEVVSRFGALIGRLYDGIPLRQAVQDVKSGFVDYNQLTQFERSTLKRFFAYYTFPRHYVPMVWNQLAKDPQQIQTLAHGIRDSGLIDTSGGGIELRAGNVRVALQRTNANIDAIMAAPALVERVIGGGKNEQDLWRGLRDPGFMAPGGMFSILFGRDAFMSLDTEMPQGHWLENAFGSTFATKWIYQSIPWIGRGDLDWGDEMLKYLVPAKSVEPGHERKVMLRNYKILESQIRDRMQNTKSAYQRRLLQDQYGKINRTLQHEIAQIPQ